MQVVSLTDVILNQNGSVPQSNRNRPLREFSAYPD